MTTFEARLASQCGNDADEDGDDSSGPRSHRRFYQLRKDNLMLGYSKDHLIKEIFDPEYEKLKFENGIA